MVCWFIGGLAGHWFSGGLAGHWLGECWFIIGLVCDDLAGPFF